MRARQVTSSSPAMSFGGWPIAHTGLVSVMPQPCTIGTPNVVEVALDQRARHRRAAAHHQAQRRQVGAAAVVQQVVQHGRHRAGQRRAWSRR